MEHLQPSTSHGHADALGDRSAGALGFVCPICRGALMNSDEAYRCEPCARLYPIVCGIADFRIYDDPHLDIESDRRKARSLDARSAQMDLESLIEHYWSLTDTPPHLARRYTRHALTGVERGRDLLADLPLDADLPHHVLELGCRSGGLLSAMTERFEHCVGIDIALRWLIIARKRLEQARRSATLVCCCADALPFASGSFHAVIAENVLEHTPRQPELLREAHRVLRPRGTLLGVTCNRFSLGPEPHVRLIGVGWLPRRCMQAYVHWRRGVDYHRVRLLSTYELKRMIRHSPFGRGNLKVPRLGLEQARGLGLLERSAIAAYRWAARDPIFAPVLLAIGPWIGFRCQREPDASSRRADSSASFTVTASDASPPPRPSNAAAEAPLFIVGCGCSGTTLLRLMLTNHPSMAIPQESHFIYRIARLAARGRWPRRLDEPSAWQGLLTLLDQDEFLRRWDFDSAAMRQRLLKLADRSHGAVFRAVFHEYAAQKAKPNWGDKTPMHVQYMMVLDRLFPNARFIHVVRDGRDVAMSLLQRRWGPRHIRLAGWYWKWLVLSGMVAGECLGPGRYRLVRYEDLVLDAPGTLRPLSDWLGLAYTPAMLDYHQSQAAEDYASAGGVARRLATPLDPARLQRWRTEMSPAHRQSFVRQAGSLLQVLGYDIDALPASQLRQAQRINHLLTTQTIRRIDLHAAPHDANAPMLSARLLCDRARQLACFLRGDLETWARLSLRWQRSVGDLLQ